MSSIAWGKINTITNVLANIPDENKIPARVNPGGKLMKKATLIFLLLAAAMLSACNNRAEQREENQTTNMNENSNTGLTGELTIASLSFTGSVNPLLESAARMFEAQNEGVTIRNVIYDNWQTYAQIINTALMSGGGEDIISIQNLQWQRLADTGRLVDMNDHIHLRPGEFYQNVLDAFLYNGGRYVIPLTFGLSAFQARDLLAPDERPSVLTLENLIELSNAHPEALLFQSGTGFGGTPASVAELFFELDFHKYIDLANRVANIDNENFITLLEAVQTMSNGLRWGEAGEEALFWEILIHSPAMTINGTDDFSDFIVATNSSGGNLASAHNGFAINANSQNQELAAAFMQFLLSKEMQTSPEIHGTPINRAAAAERSRMTISSIRAYPGYTGSTADFDLENNIAIFNKFEASVTSVGIADPMIRNFVRAEMERFFNGEVTAQEAASNLQIRLTTYLNE